MPNAEQAKLMGEAAAAFFLALREAGIEVQFALPITGQWLATMGHMQAVAAQHDPLFNLFKQ